MLHKINVVKKFHSSQFTQGKGLSCILRPADLYLQPDSAFRLELGLNLSGTKVRKKFPAVGFSL